MTNELAWLFDCFVKKKTKVKKTKLVGKTKWVPTTIKNSHQMFVHLSVHLIAKSI